MQIYTSHLTVLSFSAHVFPYVFPLQLQNAFDVVFHAVCALSLHLLCDMPINIQSKCGCRMTKVALHRLDIIT